jgi:DnaD/phage-associated family protein
MDFTKEANAFKDWVQYNTIPSNAVLLWFVLTTFKHSSGSSGAFHLSNLVVQQFTGLSRQGLSDARSKLVELNLLDYEKGNKGRDPKYQIRSLVSSSDSSVFKSQDQFNDNTNSLPALDNQTESFSNQSGAPLNQSKKTVHSTDSFQDRKASLYRNRQDKTEALTLIHFYESHIGALNLLARERLVAWQEKVSDEVICAAIEVGAEHGAKRIGYIDKILMEWERNGLKTVGEVLTYRQSKLTGRKKAFHVGHKSADAHPSVFDQLRREG